MEKYFLILIAVLCVGVFIFSVCRKKMEVFINFILRLFAGAVGIYVINSILVFFKIGSGVGLNGLNILAIGLLGLPGFLMIYVIGAYFTITA